MPDAQSPPPASLLDATRYWFRLGCTSFGGPAGQIAMMHDELVERRRWISEARFLHALNYCMVLPGPEAQQLATYIGWLMHGTLGGIIAGGLFVLPSLLLLLLLSWLYMAFGEQPVVVGILYGIKPAVTAIVLAAAYRIGKKTLKHPLLWLLAVLAFVGIAVFSMPYPLIIVSAGLVGALGGVLRPAVFSAAGGHGGALSTADHPPAWIDDHTPTPAFARFSSARAIRTLLVGLGLWGGSLALLVRWQGWDGLYTSLATFFTRMALVTFGGAYAVLPYVYQYAVNTRGWLTAPQMMAGLALGETTPGPLIMVVAFVGFVAGWNQAGLGPDSLLLAGLLGGTLVTFFTFLPSFLFILLGGPLVESSRNQLRFTAPLTGITAAVVGVIFNMALFFAWHVFWPSGLEGRFEWPAPILTAGALFALTRGGRGMIEVLAVCAGLGLLLEWGR